MNIVIANTFYPPDGRGGAERSVSVLAEGLAEAGHRVSILCTSKVQFESESKGVAIFGLGQMNVYWIGSNNAQKGSILKLIWHIFDTFNLVSFVRCLRLLKRINPEILHTNNITGLSPSVILAAKILGISTVHTLRDYYLGCVHSNAVNCSSVCPKVKSLARFISGKVDVVVGNSQFILDWHISRNYFSTAKGLVIFNAYAHEGPIAYERQNERGVVFGYIGSISKDKGVDLLCAQFEEFQKLSPGDNKLLIAGSGDSDFVGKLKARYSKCAIYFIGYALPVDFYQKIDWNVVPSVWNEPLARVCFEPKFFALPVISSCRGGNPEAINDGKDGFLFDPDIENDLLKKLCAAKSANYKVFAKNSFYDRERFRLDRLIRNYTSIYSDLRK